MAFKEPKKITTVKKYDVAVKTGTYMDGKDEKSRYENVGTVLERDGQEFMVLKRTFNPAGIYNDGERDTIILSFFEPRDDDDRGSK